MTKEHAWPEWLQATADVLPTRVRTSIGFSRTSVDTFTEAANLQRTQQGSVLTIKVREVCDRCNHGWMSRLETATRPTLERLWAGDVTKLTSGDVATLARWAVKTGWMHERAQHEDPTPTTAQRLAIARGQAPHFTRVWAARHTGMVDFWSPVARFALAHQAKTWDDPEQRHSLLAMLVFHGLALLIRTDDGPGVPPLQLDAAAWLPLAPRSSRGRLAWPPRRSVDDEDVTRRMQLHHDWTAIPDPPRFERDTRGWLERLPSPHDRRRQHQ
jgi:hypothetical protein